MAVCAGGAGLAPEDRAEALAVLTRDADEALAQRAEESLLSVSVEVLVTAVGRVDAAPQLFRYCAENLGAKPGIADALAKNPNCPAELLAEVAPHLSTAAVQGLMENLERLTAAPGLVAALAESASVTAEQRNVLKEMLKEGGEEAGFHEAAATAEPDKAKRQTLLQRLAKMRVVERMKLALTGGTTERMILIRDSNKIVQRAVLQSPRLSDREVEGYAAMANLSDEILRLVAANRNFIKNYVVVRNLLNNPKTPLDVSLHLLPRTNPQDLKMLTMNKNVPETLRTMAMKLQRQRAQAKKGGE